MARPQSAEVSPSMQSEFDSEITFHNAAEFVEVSSAHGIPAREIGQKVQEFYKQQVNPEFASRRHQMTWVAVTTAFLALREVDVLRAEVKALREIIEAHKNDAPRAVTRPTKKVKKAAPRKKKIA